MASRPPRIAPGKGPKRSLRDYALLMLLPLTMVAGCSLSSALETPANAATVAQP
jgi:hypothetical protein